MYANEDSPVFVVVDEMLQDGDNVLFASTDRRKAYKYVNERYKPETLRVEVWDGNRRMAKERVG